MLIWKNQIPTRFLSSISPFQILKWILSPIKFHFLADIEHIQVLLKIDNCSRWHSHDIHQNKLNWEVNYQIQKHLKNLILFRKALKQYRFKCFNALMKYFPFFYISMVLSIFWSTAKKGKWFQRHWYHHRLCFEAVTNKFQCIF